MHQRKQNRKKSKSPIPLLFSQIRTFFRRATRGLMRSLSRNMRGMDRRDRKRVAGFVLPTVAMVLMVVVLLSVAILFRSMERAKYAQYSKVDEAVLQAATPAIQRARAKITEVFESPEVRGTPTEIQLKQQFSTNLDDLTFGDELALKVGYKVNGTDTETIDTAWKFPIDTDNNGQFDTWTLYGIYISNPTDRARTPIDARTLPRLPVETLESGCEAVGSAFGLVGTTGWYKSGSKFKKSVFTYVANVPIRDKDIANLNSKYDSADFESFKGEGSFSALEYQQDQIRLPLSNNAVVYRDDLVISPADQFFLNGRVITNSNLLVTRFRGANTPNADLQFYLISAPESCFYDDPENSKIIVGGNVVNGHPGNNLPWGRQDVAVHFYDGDGAYNGGEDDITDAVQTVDNNPLEVIYNAEAYETRLTGLVNWAYGDDDDFGWCAKEGYNEVNDCRNALRTHFEERTRRVPYAEVDWDETTDTQDGEPDNNGDPRPQNAWVYPTQIGEGGATSETGESPLTNLTLGDGANYLFQAYNPENRTIEQELGDRILVGNNLPAVWYIDNNPKTGSDTQNIEGVEWVDGGQRTRQSRVQELPEVGSTARDGFWEKAMGVAPENPTANWGGLRVVTGAGYYLREESFLPPPKLALNTAGDTVIVGTYDDPTTSATETYEIVWPDTMPMSVPSTAKVFDNTGLYAADGTPEDTPTTAAGDSSRWVQASAGKSKGDLQMRASAVYHYSEGSSNYLEEEALESDWSKVKQTPIACVSSYYDPSTSTTAKNSENGKVYAAPGSPNWTALERQANMVYPNGRFVNPMLRQAVEANSNGETLSLAEQAAVDSTMCAIGIYDGTLGTSNVIPEGAIYETAFLDGRQVKAVEADNSGTAVDETFTLGSGEGGEGIGQLSGDYDLPMEDRQPLEIRATVLDLNLLRQATISQSVADGPSSGGSEYLLPLSGNIYATRDDTLPDWSAYDPENNPDEFVSASDFKLDPTRRPNGIMLINGRCLARGTSGCDSDTSSEEAVLQEKGLTLVSNLPVYIKGEFNPHTQEEFGPVGDLDADWGNFYNRTGLNTDFACRAGDPRLDDCNTGDNWRAANVLSDSVTLLSGADSQTGFRFGYRNEGDFDLNNNAGNTNIGYDLSGNGDIGTDTASEATFDIDLNGDGDNTDTVPEYQVTAKAARQINGFNAYNHFAVNGLTSGSEFDTDGSGTVATYADTDYQGTAGFNSSYFNNFVTPVQRRSDFPDYIMEICRKPFIEACGPTDWVVGFKFDGLEYQDGSTKIEEINTKTIQLTYPDGSTQQKSQEDLTMYDISVVIPSGKATVDGDQLKILFFSWKGMQKSFKKSGNDNISFASRLLSGTTGLPIDRAQQRFPRRISFLRDQNGGLLVNTNGNPVAIGVSPKDTGNSTTSKNQDDQHDSLDCFVSGGGITLDAATVGYDVPAVDNNNGNGVGNGQHECGDYDNRGPRLRTSENALWFRTKDGSNPNYGYENPLWFYDPATPGTPKTYTAGDTQNPLLVPVLQLNATTTNASANMATAPGGDKADFESNAIPTSWLMIADDNGGTNQTTYDAVIATGDVPVRKIGDGTGEGNGGLPNLTRFLENWRGQTVKMSGSLIQTQRSKYASAPYMSVQRNGTTIFGNGGTVYNAENTNGTTPFFSTGGQNYGFDVGLLYQPPDLFTSLLTSKSSDAQPDEFFREVNRNDEWVKGLLCATETVPTLDENGDVVTDEDGNVITTQEDAIRGSDRPDCSKYTGN